MTLTSPTRSNKPLTDRGGLSRTSPIRCWLKGYDMGTIFAGKGRSPDEFSNPYGKRSDYAAAWLQGLRAGLSPSPEGQQLYAQRRALAYPKALDLQLQRMAAALEACERIFDGPMPKTIDAWHRAEVQLRRALDEWRASS